MPLNMVSFYKPSEHTILGGDLAEFCARLVEDDPQRKRKLFVVRYNKFGTYVIAEWLAEPRDIFVDIMNLGNSLGNFTRAKAYELRKRLFDPITANDTAEHLITQESDHLHQLQDDSAEETERLAKCAIGE